MCHYQHRQRHIKEERHHEEIEKYDDREIIFLNGNENSCRV